MSRPSAGAWLAGGMACFALPKLLFSLHIADLGSDGGLYLDVARHLAAGRGFASSISDYHQGFLAFPHPTSVYPLWPCVLAASLVVAPGSFAAVWLPTALYFVAIYAAYRFGARWSPTQLISGLPLHGGHVVAALLASQLAFFEHTSMPFTEGLSFALLFSFLTRSEVLFSRTTIRDGVELGLWLAAMMACRSHLVVVLAGSLAAMLLELGLAARDRESGVGPKLRFTLAAAAVIVAAWLPFRQYLSTFLAEPGFAAYLRFDQARAIGASDWLTPFSIGGDRGSIFANVADRARGSFHAFLPGWEHGYFASYHVFALAPPLALLAVLASPAATRARAAAFLRRDGRVWRTSVLFTALAGMASIHLMHKDQSFPWYFATRHGIICAPFFAVSLLFLLRSPSRLARAAGLSVLVTGTIAGLGYEGEQALAAANQPQRAPIDSFRPAFLRWIAAQQRSNGAPLRLAAVPPLPRKLAWRLPDDVHGQVGFHVVRGSTTVADLVALNETFDVPYFAVVGHPRFVNDPRFDVEFALSTTIAETDAAADDEPVDVYVRRGSAPGSVRP